jgi:hypothetical protein
MPLDPAERRRSEQVRLRPLSRFLAGRRPGCALGRRDLGDSGRPRKSKQATVRKLYLEMVVRWYDRTKFRSLELRDNL